MWSYRGLHYSVYLFLALRSEHNVVRASSRTSSAGCDWTIHYDKWIPSFEQQPYYPNTAVAGVQCLHHCCEDPACDGLAMESSLQFQCYRYNKLPTAVNSNGESFAEFLRQPRVPRWSILKKVPLAVGMPSTVVSETALVLEAKEDAVNAQNSKKRAEESKLDQRLEYALEAPHTCEWKVYYNTWLPSFEPGEYETSADGGRHCLEACCGDPTCTGLALESSELYQCYRYAKVPDQLPSGGWNSLGDGGWLRKKKSSWSVFVKVEVPSSASAVKSVTLLPKASQPPPNFEKNASSSSSSTFSCWASWLVQSLLMLALVYLCVTRFQQILGLSSSVIAAITGQAKPASGRLLETALPQTNYTTCGSTHSEKLRPAWVC